MYKVTINQTKELQVEADKIILDLKALQPEHYHILDGETSVAATILQADFESKMFSIQIGHQVYELQLEDHYDQLIKKLGINNMASKKVNNIKAPMPGLVLDVLVEEGQEVQKGAVVLVLEAMKMENSLKAAGDGIVKKICVTKGDAVEKNQVLIELA